MALSQHLFDKLQQYLTYTPTSGQIELLRGLSEFITQPDNKAIFLINGYAGTGKTTAIAALVNLLNEFKIRYVLMAPTGRAAKVMANYSGVPAYTIHKKIYRQKSHTDGVGVFTLGKNEYVNTFFIVDEASMISNKSASESIFGSGKLLDDLYKFVQSGNGCKLILAGDTAQLPPVGTDQSPALDFQQLEKYGKVFSVHLTDVVRQAQKSGILHNATLLRKNVESIYPENPQFDFNFPDIESINGSQVLEKLTDAYERYGEHETVVVCRSNKRAIHYNNGIRSRLLFREEQLTRHDRVMIVKNCYQFLEANEEIDFIANGDVAEVLKIHKYEERYGLRYAEAVLQFPDFQQVEITAKIVLDTLQLETPSIGGDRQRQLFFDVMEDYSNIKTKQNRYRAVREDKYFNALQLKYAHAITCHKAQGGQWKAVFVDYPFREETPLTTEDLRWLYTAFTRASEKLYLVGYKAKRNP